MDVIISHIQADFDAFASMVAARLLYPGAVLVFPGAQEKNLRDYLAEASPEDTGPIVKMKDIDLDMVTRLIIVDNRQLSRIGEFARIIGKPGVEVIVYDHHPCSTEDISAHKEVCIELGSNAAVMTGILKEKGIVPNPAQATMIAMGIYEDTGSLLFPSTTPEDCRALANLLEWGLISKRYPERLCESSKLSRWTCSTSSSRMCISSTFPIDVPLPGRNRPLYRRLRHARPQIEGDVRRRRHVRTGPDGRTHIPGSTQHPAPDQCSRYRGPLRGRGAPHGRPASIRETSLDLVENRLVNLVKKEAKPRITARDIMTFPVITLGLGSTIDEASSVLNRYNINAAVVQTRDGRPVGIITRQVVTRAQGHGLGGAKVKDYMIRDIKQVSPDAPIWEIRTLIIDGNQRLLPVVDDMQTVGVITRTDLMMVLHEKMARVEGLEPRAVQTKNLKNHLDERLPRELFELLRLAGELASSMGYNVYLVGGIVRDMILRIDNLDIDLVVEGDGIAFARAFSRSIGARYAAHDKYKTAVITLPDGNHIDVATARLEYYKTPGSLPIVEQSTLKLDLYRRDFTINTMAVSLNPQRFGELIDFFGAQRDIKEKRIRVLHAMSFVEDPSRILRAVRFEQRYGFALGKQTTALVHAAVKSGLLRSVPGRRIPMRSARCSPRTTPSGEWSAQELGVLSAIHPGLTFTPQVREYFVRVKETLLWFTMLFTREAYRSWFVYLLAMVDQMKPRKILEICQRLGLTDEEVRGILSSQAKVHTILRDLASIRPIRPSDVVKILDGARLEEILFAMSKTRSPEIRELISAYITTWRSYKPPVSGRDLLALGFEKGKFLGDTLRLIRDKGLNGEIRDFSEAAAFATERLKERNTGQSNS